MTRVIEMSGMGHLPPGNARRANKEFYILSPGRDVPEVCPIYLNIESRDLGSCIKVNQSSWAAEAVRAEERSGDEIIFHLFSIRLDK